MVALDSTFELSPGEELPDFELPGVAGETYTPASFADHEALLLVFTCNHCPYAKAKFDLLNGLADAYDDVAVVGVNPNDAEQYPDDSFEVMREFVEDGRVDYDVYLRDESQRLAKALAATCTPDPYLFRNDGGTFRLAYHGRLDDALNPEDEPTRFHVREAIDAVLAGETVDLDWEPSRGCSVKWREGNEPDYWEAV
jgi:peroxiredoxin